MRDIDKQEIFYFVGLTLPFNISATVDQQDQKESKSYF